MMTVAFNHESRELTCHHRNCMIEVLSQKIIVTCTGQIPVWILDRQRDPLFIGTYKGILSSQHNPHSSRGENRQQV
jgi:hypothetical protein